MVQMKWLTVTSRWYFFPFIICVGDFVQVFFYILAPLSVWVRHACIRGKRNRKWKLVWRWRQEQERIKMTPLTGCNRPAGSMSIRAGRVWYLLLITTWHPPLNSSHSRPRCGKPPPAHASTTWAPRSPSFLLQPSHSSTNSSILPLITAAHAYTWIER